MTLNQLLKQNQSFYGASVSPVNTIWTGRSKASWYWKPPTSKIGENRDSFY